LVVSQPDSLSLVGLLTLSNGCCPIEMANCGCGNFLSRAAVPYDCSFLFFLLLDQDDKLPPIAAYAPRRAVFSSLGAYGREHIFLSGTRMTSACLSPPTLFCPTSISLLVREVGMSVFMRMHCSPL